MFRQVHRATGERRHSGQRAVDMVGHVQPRGEQNTRGSYDGHGHGRVQEMHGCRLTRGPFIYVSKKNKVGDLGFEDDACTRYIRFVLSQPLWTITPTHALAVALSRFFFEPSEHMGGAIKRFLVALLEDVPIAVYPFLLLTVVCLVGGLGLCGVRLSPIPGSPGDPGAHHHGTPSHHKVTTTPALSILHKEALL